jgi:hypothetical protein
MHRARVRTCAALPGKGSVMKPSSLASPAEQDAASPRDGLQSSPRSPAPTILCGAVVGTGVGPAREEPTFHLRDVGVADAQGAAALTASEGSSPCRWANPVERGLAELRDAPLVVPAPEWANLWSWGES